MNPPNPAPPTRRLFAEFDADRSDDLGFLDRGRTPRLVRAEGILSRPVVWVLGPPWLGKTTVAGEMFGWLRAKSDASGGVGARFTLTKLNDPTAVHEIPPPWWTDWCRADSPRPAVWLIDGLEEGLDRNDHLFSLIVKAIDAVPAGHLRRLRLILFSRPHAELGGFETSLSERYAASGMQSSLPRFWLARLDREVAAELLGPARFPAVCDLIRKNDLQPIAGYPVVLKYLARYPETAQLSVADVWRGILDALLGERASNPAAQFETTGDERFAAACRIAAVLTLTGRDAIREYSPDRDAVAFGSLFEPADNRLQVAARDATRTATFVALPELGAFRFGQRNVKDWFTAFALAGLPIAALRSALTGADGRIAPRLQEPVRLLRRLGSEDMAAAIDRLSGGVTLPTDAFDATLTEAIRCLDQLEDLARAAPWGLRLGYDSRELARLRVDGIGAVIALRLLDPCRLPQVKSLLLEVGEATRAHEAVKPASAIALDEAQQAGRRCEAMGLIGELGGDNDLLNIEAVLSDRGLSTEADRRVYGMLLQEAYRRRLWPVWQIVLRLPAVNPDLGDARTALQYRLREEITLDDAHELLPHLRTLFDRHADEERWNRFPELVDRIITLLVAQNPPPSGDLDALIRFALSLIDDQMGWPMARDLAMRLQPFANARHQFYEHDTVCRAAEGGHGIHAWNLLLPDDWRWLRDEAIGRWAGGREVWNHAYWIARRARDGHLLLDEEWREFVALVDQHAPGVPTEFEESRVRYERECEASEAEQRARRERNPTHQPLAHRVRTVLDAPNAAPAERMRQLAWLCFAPTIGVGPQAVGGWDELPDELQQQVLATCRIGLNSGTPTAIPLGGSFSGHILAEGAAFSQAVFSPGSDAWLTGTIVRRWLPTALFADRSGGWTELIRACWAVSPSSTEDVLLDTLVDQARRHEQPFQLRTIPSECWTSVMTDRIVGLLNDPVVRPRSRRDLLEQLTERDPERVDGIAIEWADLPVTVSESELRLGGLNVLLVRMPSAALDRIEPDFAARGPAAIEELSALSGWRDEFHVEWTAWPLELLDRLGRLLLQSYPPAADPDFREGFVTPDQQLRHVRDQLIDNLMGRSDAASQAVLDGLAATDSSILRWVSNRRASEQARVMLPGFAPAAARDETAVTRSEAVRLLDRSGFRLIRSTDDLLDAVLEAFREIERDAGHDLAILYGPPDRTAGRAGAHINPRKHLEEDALQAYFRRRLFDCLGRIVDGVVIPPPLREDRVARRRRLDLRIVAPCRGGRSTATVVVEVKWSDNREVRTGLACQLGENYLLAEGLTHGVFLVGWTGEWHPGDGDGADHDADRLREFLENRRAEFCDPGQLGHALHIAPVVLNLEWAL